jgi:hypothetical protein
MLAAFGHQSKIRMAPTGDHLWATLRGDYFSKCWDAFRDDKARILGVSNFYGVQCVSQRHFAFIEASPDNATVST